MNYLKRSDVIYSNAISITLSTFFKYDNRLILELLKEITNKDVKTFDRFIKEIYICIQKQPC